jgi:hypothetical protein
VPSDAKRAWQPADGSSRPGIAAATVIVWRARPVATWMGTGLLGSSSGLTLATSHRCWLGAAEEHEDVARAVRLAAAGPADRLKVLRIEVDRGLRTRRFLDYRESSAWTRDAWPVVDALAREVAARPSRELVVLLERAVGHVVKVILHADDSDGLIGDLVRRLLELHEQACDAGVAEPVGLARWMARLTFDDQDFFVVDPVRYASALGDRGLAAYRSEVERCTAGGGRSFAVSYAVERLAVLDGDVGRLVELLGGDLTTPYQFIRVAEAMVELGRADDALAWARRGIAGTSGWQVAKLYDIAYDVLTARGDTTAVLDLRRDQHRGTPSSSTYELLRRAADAAHRWPDERPAARGVLRLHDLGGFVDVLLVDGEPDEAWSVATSNPRWDPGERRWQRLAEAREPTDPSAAMTVYLRLADTALVDADRRNYQVAVRHLKAARRAAITAGRSAEFDHRVGELREQPSTPHADLHA